MSERRDIIFELVRVRHAIKVSAVDPATGTEVSIVGDPAVGESALKRLAMRKLEYVLARRKTR